MRKAITLILVAALALAGCGLDRAPASVPPAPAVETPVQVVRFALGGEPETIDPSLAEDNVSAAVIHQLFEGLTRKEVGGGIGPGIAERWQVTTDGLTYLFTLRPARWSNGDPVTAADFEYAWKRVLDPAKRSPYAYQLYYLVGAEAFHQADPKIAGPRRMDALRDGVGVRAVDERVLEVRLKAPAPFFLELVSFLPYLPVHRQTVEGDPQRWWAAPSTFVGNGPFKLAEWKREGPRLEKNETYWEASAVKLRRVHMLPAPDIDGALSMFEAGDVDLAMPRLVPPSEAPRLLGAGEARRAPFLATYYLAYNTARGPFRDARVRRAFALAIDRRALVDEVLYGLPIPALALVPPGIPNPSTGRDFREEGGDYLPNHDPEEARKLLAEAGYPDGRGFPRVTLLYNAEGEQGEVMDALKRMWKDNLGVDVQLSGQDWASYLKARDAGTYDIVRVGWIGDFTDPLAFLDLFRGGGPRNDARWRDAEFDARLDAAARAGHPDERFQALHDAEARLAQEMPVAPIYFYVQVWLQKPYLKDVFVDLQGGAFLRAAYLAPRPAGAR